jgi:response regulator RpfG family c-di-GMP phosphodiesterase
MTTVATASRSKPRVLCVDDEPQVLEGLTLSLRRRFDVLTAPGAREGLAAIADAVRAGGLAVVISDMRMPHMTGAVFLSHVRQTWPDVTRLLLTGHADIEAAIMAVNEGQIFRFLSKPCATDKLIEAVDAAVEQNRLINAEKVLLEQTLHGSIKALTDILSIQNPLAFGRATRAKGHVAALATAVGLPDRWAAEVAAMLSPIGTVTLPSETVERLYDCKPLSAPEQAMVKRLPVVTEQLLANIPRLEPVREILAHKELRFDGEGGGKKGTDLSLGGRMLKIALDYDVLEAQGNSIALALDTLRGRKGLYDPDLLTSFASVLGGRQAEAVIQELPLGRLRAGMVFLDDVRTVSGGLLVAHGHEVTDSLLERMRNFSRNVSLKEPFRVQVPAHLVGAGD